MSVRRGLAYVLALLLGLSGGLLAACGGGGTKSGIPSASAGELKSQITDVGQAVDDGRCDDVEGQLKQVDRDIDQLPQTTDDQLVSALRDGADRLRRVAVEECDPDTGTETTTTETTTTETPTETVPEEEPTETLPTETTQEPTTTAPPPPPPPTGGTPPAPTPPPVTPPVAPTPPPVSPGGGVTPEIDPDG